MALQEGIKDVPQDKWQWAQHTEMNGTAVLEKFKAPRDYSKKSEWSHDLTGCLRNPDKEQVPSQQKERSHLQSG